MGLLHQTLLLKLMAQLARARATMFMTRLLNLVFVRKHRPSTLEIRVFLATFQCTGAMTLGNVNTALNINFSTL